MGNPVKPRLALFAIPFLLVACGGKPAAPAVDAPPPGSEWHTQLAHVRDLLADLDPADLPMIREALAWSQKSGYLR